MIYDDYLFTTFLSCADTVTVFRACFQLRLFPIDCIHALLEAICFFVD